MTAPVIEPPTLIPALEVPENRLMINPFNATFEAWIFKPLEPEILAPRPQLDQQDGVIAIGERVGAGAGLGVAVDDRPGR